MKSRGITNLHKKILESSNSLAMIGGAIDENKGRLKYIDGCTDSLLVPPVKLGDPCLNALYFPAEIDQTTHTHPSMRVGVVVSGNGECVTEDEVIHLIPGMVFIIHEEGLHKFRTLGSKGMVVVAYHPDSDFGPEDEHHPMINRTIVDGIPASQIESIRTR
jgi:mannose-6-phosphate isomerase-like protein (cupin superfamily)